MTYSNEASTIITLLSDRPVAYHPALARLVGGVKAAVFLCQLLYWHGKGNDPDGWIWKTQAEMEKETALTRCEQEGARKKLVKLDLMEEKLQGIPARLHYRIKTDKLAALVQTGLENSCKQDCGKPANKIAENLQSNSETTFIDKDSNANAFESESTEQEIKIPNPIDYRVKDIQAWELPKDAWSLVAKMERAGKNRKGVLRHCEMVVKVISPAIMTINKITKLYPEEELWSIIDEAVGNKESDLAFWRKVVLNYIGQGWNPTNYMNMLDYYKRRKIPRTNSPSRASPRGRQVQKQKSDPYAGMEPIDELGCRF